MWVVNATPRPLYPQKRPGTHCIGGWVGPRTGLNGCGKSRPSGFRSPDRPAPSELLYRLSYPDLYICKVIGKKYYCLYWFNICFYIKTSVWQKDTKKELKIKLPVSLCVSVQRKMALLRIICWGWRSVWPSLERSWMWRNAWRWRKVPEAT